MRSELHKQLQGVAKNYLLNKAYWICGQEVPMPQGICDAWGMKHFDLETMAIEVKVSRPDFHSLSQKCKESSSSVLGNYQYILCPQGLIGAKECHDKWGLLWFENGRIINKKKAPFLSMTAEQKLDVLIHFLFNGVNEKRPKLVNIGSFVLRKLSHE